MNYEKIIFLFTAVFLIAIPVFSQAVPIKPIKPENPVAAVATDFSMLAGIVAAVSVIVT